MVILTISRLLSSFKSTYSCRAAAMHDAFSGQQAVVVLRRPPMGVRTPTTDRRPP